MYIEKYNIFGVGSNCDNLSIDFGQRVKRNLFFFFGFQCLFAKDFSVCSCTVIYIQN